MRRNTGAIARGHGGYGELFSLLFRLVVNVQVGCRVPVIETSPHPSLSVSASAIFGVLNFICFINV